MTAPGRRRLGVSRRAAVGLLGAAEARRCWRKRRRAQAAPPQLDRVSFVTNWRAQPEHGGFH
jgi:NitT/TauT family transport system substrate-binding protein